MVYSMVLKFLEPVWETNRFVTCQPNDRMNFSATIREIGAVWEPFFHQK